MLQLVVHRQESDGYSKLCGFDHTPRSRDVQKFDWRSRTGLRERLCVSVLSKIALPFLSFFSILCVSMVAMPTGYKLVISRALRDAWHLLPSTLGRFAPSCFGAINAIHPSRPWYNYYIHIYNMYVSQTRRIYQCSWWQSIILCSLSCDYYAVSWWRSICCSVSCDYYKYV